MKKIRAYNIVWDCTDDGILHSDGVDLPTTADFVVPNDFDAEYELADLLSDTWHYCVLGCEYVYLA